jgi:hypothetical protein
VQTGFTPNADSARSPSRFRVAAARADCPVRWQALLWYSAGLPGF